MKLQPKHIPYGVIIILVVWILLQDRAHENRLAEKDATIGTLEARIRSRDIAADLYEVRLAGVTAMYEATVIAREVSDRLNDSLITVINTRPHVPPRRRPRTAPEYRESILRATRTQ